MCSKNFLKTAAITVGSIAASLFAPAAVAREHHGYRGYNRDYDGRGYSYRYYREPYFYYGPRYHRHWRHHRHWW